MSWRRKFKGGLLGGIGFLLSPLSWWNDLVVNVPLAILFGWAVSLVHPPAFLAAAVIGYWLTNVLGLVLLRWGARQALAGDFKHFSKKELLKDLAVSLVYTAILVALVKAKLVQPLAAYFAR